MKYEARWSSNGGSYFCRGQLFRTKKEAICWARASAAGHTSIGNVGSWAVYNLKNYEYVIGGDVTRSVGGVKYYLNKEE